VFGLTKAKLPVTPDQQTWVDWSFTRLAETLGAERLHTAVVMLPTPHHFPDPYDGSEAALQRMFERVAHAMDVNPASVRLTVFDNAGHISENLMPFGAGQASGPGGFYKQDDAGRTEISISAEKLKDPAALVAVLAHELGHVILLRPGLVDRNAFDMEPLNDLLTVFLGLGVFTANASFRFRQFTDNGKQGWSAQRLGYLSEELFAYALARFAYERHEQNPAWSTQVAPNLRGYFKRSLRWLAEQHAPRLLVE
jgi:hypothetical protein